MEEAEHRTSNESKPYRDDGLIRARFSLSKACQYTNAAGSTIYEVLRYECSGVPAAKCFRQRRMHRGEWIADAGLVKVPYRWPELVSRPNEAACSTEGEKDADRLAEAGLLATTLAGQHWSMTAAKALAGRDVVLLLDSDKAGWKHEADAVENLEGFASTIRVLRLLRCSGPAV